MIEDQYRLEYLHSISGGDIDFVNDMLQTFVANVPKELLKIRLLVEKKDWDSVGAESHRFASNLVFLELESLREVAIEIENISTAQRKTEKIPDLLKRLEEGCSNVIEALKSDFPLVICI